MAKTKALKSALLAKTAANTREVELPSGLGTVTVRGLTRKEALAVRGIELSEDAAECKLLALVDPEMTEEEVGQWQEVSPAADLMPVVDAVLGLSGMRADSTREAAADFRA